MTVVVLGGHDRFESPLRSFGRERGIKVKFISKPSQNLEDAISQADLIIVVPSLVSHEMVRLAKKIGCHKCIFCKQKGLCEIKRQIELYLEKKGRS